jgi:hypothetical protein
MPGRQRQNVVGYETGYELRSAGTAEADADTVTAIDQQCAGAQCRVLARIRHTFN